MSLSLKDQWSSSRPKGYTRVWSRKNETLSLGAPDSLGNTAIFMIHNNETSERYRIEQGHGSDDQEKKVSESLTGKRPPLHPARRSGI